MDPSDSTSPYPTPPDSPYPPLPSPPSHIPHRSHPLPLPDTSPSPQSPPPPAVCECVACLSTTPPIVPACPIDDAHTYCGGCLRRMFVAAASSSAAMPPRCCPPAVIQPHHGFRFLQDGDYDDSNDDAATADGSGDDVRMRGDGEGGEGKEVKERFKLRFEEWRIPAANRRYCPVRTCSAYVPRRVWEAAPGRAEWYRRRRQQQQGMRRGAVVAGSAGGGGGGCFDEMERPTVECPSCAAALCAWCGKLGHPDEECGARRSPGEEEDAAVRRELLRRGYKACPWCGVLAQKAFGCAHVCCAVCRAHWCWLCRRLQSGDGHECEFEGEGDGDADDEDEGDWSPQYGVHPGLDDRFIDNHRTGRQEWRHEDLGPEPNLRDADQIWNCSHRFMEAVIWMDDLVEGHGENMVCMHCWGTIYPEVRGFEGDHERPYIKAESDDDEDDEYSSDDYSDGRSDGYSTASSDRMSWSPTYTGATQQQADPWIALANPSSQGLRGDAPVFHPQSAPAPHITTGAGKMGFGVSSPLFAVPGGSASARPAVPPPVLDDDVRAYECKWCYLLLCGKCSYQEM